MYFPMTLKDEVTVRECMSKNSFQENQRVIHIFTMFAGHFSYS